MVRLTADLILSSPQYFNAVKERELDLRGNKISVIENLGATEDQYDSIDLSDNEIVKLEGFPYLKRLTTLLVNNNRIARISASIGERLPKLQTLVLTSNRLVNLAELDPLASLPRLWSLSLIDNIVSKKPNYRLYLVHKLPKLRLLDFKKVKQKEREEAKKMFGDKGAELTAKKASANTFVPGEALEEATSATPGRNRGVANPGRGRAPRKYLRLPGDEPMGGEEPEGADASKEAPNGEAPAGTAQAMDED
eukprot:jgi/Mesen1/8150/ME000438S07252